MAKASRRAKLKEVLAKSEGLRVVLCPFTEWTCEHPVGEAGTTDASGVATLAVPAIRRRRRDSGASRGA